jgi:Protein of unknown function (DUF3617)
MRRTVLVLLLAAPAVALAQDIPKLKAGLWEITNSSPGRANGPSMTSTLCLDQSVQQDMIKMSAGMMQGLCSKHDMKVSGNKITGSATCKLGDSTMTSTSVMTMNGDTSYRTEAHAAFQPPYMGQSQSDTVVIGKHIGACKPGQQPGDLVMPTGQTINIRNIMGAKK